MSVDPSGWNPSQVAKGIAIGRVVYGAACMTVPKVALGPEAKNAPESMLWMGRAFGVRDVVIGLGALRALRSGDGAAAWVEAGALADTLDIANAAVFRRELGLAGILGTGALAVPAAVGGWWAARRGLGY